MGKKFRNIVNLSVLAFSFCILVGDALAEKADNSTTIFAAASLKDAVSEVGTAFAVKEKSKVHYNFAGSNVLAQQIAATESADIFVSANQEWMDFLQKANRLAPETRKILLSNRIVVVANKNSPWTMQKPEDLTKLPFRFLSMGDPESVPAGKYAKAYMKKTPVGDSSIWAIVSKKIAPAADVRAALAVVESDATVVGIVYRTDAVASSNVRILFEIPETDVPSIEYTVARIERKGAPAESKKFYDFLFGKQAQEIFAKHGFLLPKK